MKIRGIVRVLVVAGFVIVLCFEIFTRPTTMANPAESGIQGMVTDPAGKPIRGATVKVAMGTKAISRFTDQNGRYQITGLQAGDYRITVLAYGYETKSQTQDIAQSAQATFVLKPHWNVSQLSGAEIESALPENEETRFLYTNCTTCHTLTPMFLKKGLKADEWDSTIHGMAEKSLAKLGLSPLPPAAILANITRILEKYVGPDAPDLTEDEVKHVEPSDAVLQATFYEFDIPSSNTFPHGISTDSHGNGWFDEFDIVANRIGRLNFGAGEVTEFPFPLTGAWPIAARVDKDGKVWVGLRHDKKLSYLDPATGQFTVMAATLPAARKGEFDLAGNYWGSGGDGIYEFNKTTQKVQDYRGPLPKDIPQESAATWGTLPGQPVHVPEEGLNGAGAYDVTVDSKGRIWYTQYNLGTLVRLDPETGKSTPFKFPGIPAVRGVTVDAKDNVWYGDNYGWKLVKFDQKTEQSKLYQPPTTKAIPYGVVADRNGNIWYGDYNGNNITRFDPRTEQFTEYPIPTRSAMPRFISVDDQGRVWFTEWWQNKIGVLIPTGMSKPAVASLK